MINNKLPLVSICIPTYNGAKYIVETLESALSQTYQNIEILICDDNSTDDTVAICKKIAEKDLRVKVYENEKNLGLVLNWVEVLKKASSNWVKFLFQDDLLSDDCVEKMINAALDNQVDFVICNRQYFFNENVSPKIQKFYTGLVKTDKVFPSNQVITPERTAKCINKHFFNNCIGEPPTFLFNKEKVSNKDFPLDYKQLVDYVFILNKILVYSFVFLNEELVKFRVHMDSESMQTSNKSLEDSGKFYKYIYVKFFERIKLCYELIHNPNFKLLKAEIPIEHIKHIRDWTVIKSYNRLGFKRSKEFYEKSNLKEFAINANTKTYSYLKYKYLKLSKKRIRDAYKA